MAWRGCMSWKTTLPIPCSRARTIVLTRFPKWAQHKSKCNICYSISKQRKTCTFNFKVSGWQQIQLSGNEELCLHNLTVSYFAFPIMPLCENISLTLRPVEIPHCFRMSALTTMFFPCRKVNCLQSKFTWCSRQVSPRQIIVLLT